MEKKVKKQLITLAITGTLLGTLVPTNAQAYNHDYYKNGPRIGDLRKFILDDQLFRDLVFHLEDYNYELNGKLFNSLEIHELFSKYPTLTSDELYAKVLEVGLKGETLSESTLVAQYTGGTLATVVINLNGKGVTSKTDVTNIIVDGTPISRYDIDSKGNLGFEVYKKPTSISLQVKGKTISITDIRLMK